MIRRNKQEVVDYFLEKQAIDKYYSTVDLAKDLGYATTWRVCKILKEFNISYVIFDRNKKQHRSFDQSVLTGNLLGDGFIYYSSTNSTYPVFSVEYKHQEYCNYIQSVNPFLNGRKVNYRKRYDDRYISGSIEQYHCKSLSSSVLKNLYDKWYGSGSKQVPNDIVLNPQTMLIWFMDDGYKTSSCSGLYLATDGFSLESSELLKNKLEEFDLRINFHKASSKDNVRLYITSKSSKDFLNIIGPSPVKCYQYKWE